MELYTCLRAFGRNADGLLKPSRRRFVQGLAAGDAVAGLGFWPRPGWALKGPGTPHVLSGTEFDLTIGETPMNFTGRTRTAKCGQWFVAGAHPALERAPR